MEERLNIHRSSQIFRDALDVSDAERSAFVESACAGDRELRAGVERLLALAFADGPELARPELTDVTAAANVRGTAQNVGQIVGAFSLVRPIGTGGMGAVWLAERVESFSQQVAIKWLHAGLSRTARTRFARERETLAKLEHPGIARIVDGGSDFDADWYAMEFVDGLALDQYAKANNLDLPARLKLVLQLCEAVQYAHQNLIVHRDLKPANVLVGKDGAPKLLDFGIAKSLHENSDLTASAAPMTFAYAAPEQIKNERITTATDVYALGVILYELLTGQRPHKVKAGSGDGSLSILQAITDTDATAPSSMLARDTATGRGIKASALKGDLDTIVLKALNRDPVRRYASAQALADDLRRFLANEPIHARADSASYQVQKFLRRNRFAASVVALATLALIALTGVSMLQARRADRAAVAAISSEQRATASAVTAENERNATLEQLRNQEALREHFLAVLAQATARSEPISSAELLELAADTHLSPSSNQPAVQRAVVLGMAEVFMLRNDYPRVLKLLDAAAPLIAQGSVDDRLKDLTLQGYVQLRIGTVESVEAIITQGQALLTQHKLQDTFAAATFLLLKGQLLQAQGDLKGGLALLIQAADIAQAATTQSALDRGVMIGNLAVMQLQAGQIAPSLASAERAEKIWRIANVTQNAQSQTLASVRGNALVTLGSAKQALLAYDELAKHSAAESPPATAARLMAHARALLLDGQNDAAMRMIAPAIELMCNTTGAASLECVRAHLATGEIALGSGNLSLALAELASVQKINQISPIAANTPLISLFESLLKLQQSSTPAALTQASNALHSYAASSTMGAYRTVRQTLQLAHTLRSHQREAEALALARVADELAQKLEYPEDSNDAVMLALWRTQADTSGRRQALQRAQAVMGAGHIWLRGW